jgi:hypothetical protein
MIRYLEKFFCCLSTCNPPSPYHSYPSLSSSSVDIGRKAKTSKTLLMKNRLNSSRAECSEEPTSMSWLSTALTEIWLRRRLLLARIVEFWIYCTYISFLLIARIIFCCYNNSTFEIACSIFPFQILFFFKFPFILFSFLLSEYHVLRHNTSIDDNCYDVSSLTRILWAKEIIQLSIGCWCVNLHLHKVVCIILALCIGKHARTQNICLCGCAQLHMYNFTCPI